nr:AAA family ATPase [uncultured Carboxylicivirga sp.]
MKYINEITLKNFTCFENETINFSKGINIFLGKNGVGKTHLLKILFSHFKAYWFYENEYDLTDPENGRTTILEEINEKIEDCFLLENIEPLNRNDKNFEVSINYNNHNIITSSDGERLMGNTMPILRKNELKNAIYIPPSEVMTAFERFAHFSEIKSMNLDATYQYIAKHLQEDKCSEVEFESLNKAIEDHLGGQIERDENGFYQQKNGKKIYTSLMADGIKKIATIKHLIETNNINSNTILFIDEPEVHLNPFLLNKFVDILIELEASGVQLFISSHDYLITYLLSLKSEYQKNSNICFYSLTETDAGTKISSASQVAHLENNSIIDEYNRLLEIEHEYFFKEDLND